MAMWRVRDLVLSTIVLGFGLVVSVGLSAASELKFEGPLTLYVGFAAGGQIDTAARVLADRLKDRIGRPVLGQVLRDNATMIAMCRELGFSVQSDPDDASICVVRLSMASLGGLPS